MDILRNLFRDRQASPRSVVHIGFHKTGTTSIQHFLAANSAKLKQLGVAFYEGQHLSNNHVELHLAAMRPERTSPFKLLRNIDCDEIYRAATIARIGDFAECHRGRILLFSAEGISLLRYEDEVAYLREMIPGPVKIVAYLRNPAQYLASYTDQLLKMGIRPDRSDRDSFAYVRGDSWLLDYDARLRPFRRVFGARQVDVIDYDLESTKRESVIPSLLDTIGVRAHFSVDDWSGMYLNQRARR